MCNVWSHFQNKSTVVVVRMNHPADLIVLLQALGSFWHLRLLFPSSSPPAGSASSSIFSLVVVVRFCGLAREWIWSCCSCCVYVSCRFSVQTAFSCSFVVTDRDESDVDLLMKTLNFTLLLIFHTSYLLAGGDLKQDASPLFKKWPSTIHPSPSCGRRCAGTERWFGQMFWSRLCHQMNWLCCHH